jgi:hypothetical protein
MVAQHATKASTVASEVTVAKTAPGAPHAHVLTDTHSLQQQAVAQVAQLVLDAQWTLSMLCSERNGRLWGSGPECWMRVTLCHRYRDLQPKLLRPSPAHSG